MSCICDRVTFDGEPVLEHWASELAREVGRLRRRINADPQLARFVHLADRLAGIAETVDAIVSPSAAELTIEAFAIAGDWDVAADVALEHVDRRARRIRGLLSEAPR